MFFNLASIQLFMLALLPKVTETLHTFTVGERVIWSYKAHASHGQVQKVPAEVVRLGMKRVQIRVKQNNGEFVNRWVNQSKLEKVERPL